MPPDRAGANVRAADAATIEEAAARLARGEVVAFPTETVYGLGADAADRAAVAEIYRIKGRPADHPLIVHVLDEAQASWWGELGDDGLRLVRAFWPGPLTLIVRRRDAAPAWACGGERTVGLRCPSHPVARALLASFSRLGGHGVAAPSANRFGRVSPTRASHVADDLGGDVSMIVDGGPCDVGVESTIVDVSRGDAVLLRPGGVPADAIARVLGRAPGERDAASPRASGTLPAHYAPRTPVELVDAGGLDARLARLAELGERVAVWSREKRAGAQAHWEPAAADAASFARSLYDTLRRLDRLEVDRIVVERLPAGHDWDAARDRLARAAAAFGR